MLLPSTAFRNQIQAQQDTFPSPEGTPAFQDRSACEVWPKEAAAPFISVPMAMPAGRGSDLQLLPDHRAPGDIKRNHKGWWPALALCLLTRTDPTKASAPQGCICVTHTSRAASSVTAPVLLSRAWGLRDILACPFLPSQSDSELT